MSMHTPVSTYKPSRFIDARKEMPEKTTADAFSSARTVSVYQIVDDVLLGTGRNSDGDVYDMRVPIGVDLYYSPEFGGVNAKYTMKEWETTGKEIILRGWYYQGRNFSKATRDGRDFNDYMLDCLKTIEVSVNEHFSPVAPEVETVILRVAPLWAKFCLMATIILTVLLMLSVR